jgi:hypothetical protein
VGRGRRRRRRFIYASGHQLRDLDPAPHRLVVPPLLFAATDQIRAIAADRLTVTGGWSPGSAG